jgi:hypothetical protein
VNSIFDQDQQEKSGKNKYKSGAFSDNTLIIAHLLFIIFSFVFAYQAPFYLGFLMIILHKGHEIYFGECYLTLLQKRYNYSSPEDDFFYHLFERLNLKTNRIFTRNIHRAIKTIIFLIVVFKMINYYLN